MPGQQQQQQSQQPVLMQPMMPVQLTASSPGAPAAAGLYMAHIM
jgi:membrane protein insertase Oxa1/YidC/SpoIIIJ